MLKLLIIADDFTGALDNAVQFVKKGIETQVVTGAQLDRTAISATAQVLVVDSETRPMSAADAYHSVMRIVRQGIRMGVKVIYKKTDSALRGNVGSELSAVLDATGGKRIYFIPAFPAVRRITLKGVHYIDGVRLEESSFGQDPFDPMDCSSVPEILARQTEKPVISVSVGEPIPRQRAGQEILVFDALKDGDILTRVEELRRRGELCLLAGCAGFASFLPDALGLTGNYRGEVRKSKCFYVACGSLNPITREQLRYAQENGFYRGTLTPEQKLWPEYYETEQGGRFLQRLTGICQSRRLVEMDSFDPDGQETTDEYAARFGIGNEEIRFSVSACHGRIVRHLLEQNMDMTVLMTGGDTLMGFMKEIGVNQLTPVAEVGQGTVLSQLLWKGKVLQVISKSGGFGDEAVLVKIAQQVVA